jgi:tRNA (guanosine-2'-O-)-methyltransferase
MLPDLSQNPAILSRLTEHLSHFVMPQRLKKFNELIVHRTRHITVVLEDIFQPHNASAVLRTCDCFGIQDVHIIENQNKYQVNPDVALGASKWLTLKKYTGETSNTARCLKELKSQGYSIVATTPHQNDYTPETLPLDRKTALVFGTELKGLTSEAIDLADAYVRIPMVGFTESLNISVSAATLLYPLTQRLRSSDIPWQLGEDESAEVLLSWLMQSVKKSDIIVSDFLRQQPGV